MPVTEPENIATQQKVDDVAEKLKEKTKSRITNQKKKPNFFIKWLKYESDRTRYFALFGVIVFGLAATLAASYFCIYTWLPQLWAWGFHPVSWRSIFSVLGAVYLVLGGVVPLIYTANTVQAIMALFAEDAQKDFTTKLTEIEKKQNYYEDQLMAKDEPGLIPLVTYSRIELEQYYKIGLSQNQNSYTYSIVAMWIGFGIILFGISSYIFPLKFVNQQLSAGNFQALIVASGIFTEFISALFLWIYKSSVNNLTYFYNRQMFIHNTLLAYKISSTMADGDETKKLIVEKILDFGSRHQSSVFELGKTSFNKSGISKKETVSAEG